MLEYKQCGTTKIRTKKTGRQCFVSFHICQVKNIYKTLLVYACLEGKRGSFWGGGGCNDEIWVVATQIFLIFNLTNWEMIQFDLTNFSDGLVQPPTGNVHNFFLSRPDTFASRTAALQVGLAVGLERKGLMVIYHDYMT